MAGNGLWGKDKNTGRPKIGGFGSKFVANDGERLGVKSKQFFD